MNSRKIKKNLRVLIQPTPNGKKWWVSGAFTTAEIPDLIDQLKQIRKVEREMNSPENVFRRNNPQVY
ncbi:MAG: hypothetical protein E6Q61_06255 [Nitrosomonas sp.]|nr:MAG: hypothetical protein E6Q61_06255 [Nitrosomonas sp.]